jgi:hypothetical protein
MHYVSTLPSGMSTHSSCVYGGLEYGRVMADESVTLIVAASYVVAIGICELSIS